MRYISTKTLLKIGVGLVVFAVGIVALVWFLTGDAAKVANRQLEAIGQGDITKAYSYASAEFKTATSEDEFRTFVNSYEVLKNYQKSSFNNREVKNNTATLGGTLTAVSGATANVEYQLIKEDGDWKVLGLSISGAGVSSDMPQETSTPSSSLTNTFDESGFGYTIGYPSSWVYEKSDASTILFSGAQGNADYDATVNIQNIIGTDASALIADLKNQIISGDTASRISGEKSYSHFKANGTLSSGYEFTATYTYQSTVYEQRQIVIPSGSSGILYAWAYTAPTTIYDQYLPIADAMLSSWQIAVNSSPSGEIIVEAGNGTLVNGGSWSYIAESARGLEAYLGDGGAQAVYSVTAPTAGTYTLSVKLSDDAQHSSGARSATVTVGSQTLKYNHISEDTLGWKWYTLGQVSLTSGANTITFTKDADTTAAYVMDEFKLTPVQ